jgi:hypothetical protein
MNRNIIEVSPKMEIKGDCLEIRYASGDVTRIERDKAGIVKVTEIKEDKVTEFPLLTQDKRG